MFCLARSDTWRGLALIFPPVPCRKAVTCIDYFGTGAVIIDIVVRETWKKGLHVYKWSDKHQISFWSYCISQNFNARISAFCLSSVFMCFVCFWKTWTILFLNSITKFVLPLEMHFIFFEVGSKSLTIICKYFMLQIFNQ